MPPYLTDPSLVAAARRGDQTAFAALIDRHYKTLLTSCQRMVGNAEDAHDAAQEAVLRALLGLGRLRDDASFGAWLAGIGLNVCRGLLVERASRSRSSVGAHADERIAERAADGRGAVELIVAGEVVARVRSALTALPCGQRNAALLFYLGGLTHSEIAAELDTQPGAIKTRLYKARKTLRASLLNTYQEYFDMTDQTAQLIPMHVAELRRTTHPRPGEERHIVFVQDDGDRRLPIWIGAAEATAMAVILDNVELPRPGAYQFAASLLTGAGGQLREVRVTELSSATFYAQAILSDGTSIDARPSDALTLALITDSPIYVTAGVLEQADQSRAAFSDLHDEADAATDDAHVIAQETQASIAASRAEMSRYENPSS
jgi:RNA polymerase sigma factor (sigma-70 family)